MIFALRHPPLLLGLVLGFVIGVAARAAVQRSLARPGGLRGRRLSMAGASRPRLGWAGYLDPYGTVAAVLSGVGWGVRPARRTGTSADWLMLVAALAVHAALAALGLTLFAAVGGHLALFQIVSVSDVLRGQPLSLLVAPSAGLQLAIGFALINLACGVLALVPIPPLELGVALWSRLPRSPGARRVAYHVLEEQWGVAAILLLLLLPLGGLGPPLLAVIDAVGSAVLPKL